MIYRFRIVLITLTGIALCVVIVHGGMRLFKIESAALAVMQLLVMLVAYMILAIWLGRHICSWLGDLVSRLFWPNDQVVPMPLYPLIQSYLKKGELEKALFEYEKILHYHPRESTAHLGRLTLMIELKYTPAKIQKAYEKSFKTLAKKEDRSLLNLIFNPYYKALKNL